MSPGVIYACGCQGQEMWYSLHFPNEKFGREMVGNVSQLYLAGILARCHRCNVRQVASDKYSRP